MNDILEKVTIFIGCIFGGTLCLVVSFFLIMVGARAIGVLLGIVGCHIFFYPFLSYFLSYSELQSDVIIISLALLLNFGYYEIWLNSTLTFFHVLMLIIIVFLFLMFTISKIKKWYNLLIILRPFLIIIGIVYPLFYFFPSFFRFVFYGSERDNWILLCIVGYLIIQLAYYNKNIFVRIKHLHFLKIDTSSPYFLYLRSFNSDKKYKSHLEEIERFANNKKVYAIGNPQTLFQCLTSQFHVYYLPNTNWQEAINKLSEKAECIFINVSITEGVLWEIASHQKWNNKTIYCADGIFQLSSFIHESKKAEIIPNEFINSIEKAYSSSHQTINNFRLKFPWITENELTYIDNIVYEFVKLGLLKSEHLSNSQLDNFKNGLIHIMWEMLKMNNTNAFMDIRGELFHLLDKGIITKSTDSQKAIDNIITELISLGAIDFDKRPMSSTGLMSSTELLKIRLFNPTSLIDYMQVPEYNILKDSNTLFFTITNNVCVFANSLYDIHKQIYLQTCTE